MIEGLSEYDDMPDIREIDIRSFAKRLEHITDPSYYPQFVAAYLEGTPEDYSYTLNLVDAEGNTYGFEFEDMHVIVYFNGELTYFHFNPS